MRRQNILLLAQARYDPTARCEVGRRYLLGVEGFAQHVPTGIEYLTHCSVNEMPEAAAIISECLPLETIVTLGQEAALLRAANAGSAGAQFKIAVWLCLRHGPAQPARWLDAAAASGHEGARRARAALGRSDSDAGLLEFARVVSGVDGVHLEPIAALGATRAAQERDLCRMARCLRVALAMAPRLSVALATLVVEAVHLAEQTGQERPGLDVSQVEAALDLLAHDGNRAADYLLGRALCGIACGSLQTAGLVSSGNLRKGSALLLRAADAGCEEAWMHLYRVHADHRCSVANPQMARFFLEKAAILGHAEAQRRLGALTLRSATSLKDSETGIHWLHEAVQQGDAFAMRLLKSLVLPLAGADDAADHAIDSVRRTDPWLAVRLRMSRDFGLTKLEALCADPAEGRRPWGLVVGKNPFIAQSKLSAPRAVPAVSTAVLDNLHRAALFFEETQRDGSLFEGDWRRRSLHQRRVFARYHLDEDMFFARVNSPTLDAMRQGTKWALRAKQSLHSALSA
ncbi:MAG: hypothetical protein ABL900_00545 [Burkholderiaceae bacterium]